MDAKILLSLTIMTVISCLRVTKVSSFVTPGGKVGHLGKDGNQTAWAVYPLKPHPQKKQIPRAWPFWCKSYTQAQLITKLNILGAPHYGYNPLYMAFTWEEARKFPNLVSTTSWWPQEVSPIRNLPLRAPSQPKSLMSSENCQTADGSYKRICSECPTVTSLGDLKIPSFINEVTCGQLSCSGKESTRTCKTGIMRQQFYYKTGRCDSAGYEELEPYTQEIRVCCKCMVW
ncbi:putative skeletal organic matrix protein 8 [Oculina patagonica]